VRDWPYSSFTSMSGVASSQPTGRAMSKTM
jgi:hypothetical protein